MPRRCSQSGQPSGRTILDRSLAGNDGLNEESEHGEHSQPSVLQLLHLQLGEGVWVLSQVQGVELASGVDWVGHVSQGSSCYSVSLDGTHEHDLAGPDRQNALGVDEARVAQVVQTSLGEDLRSSLEPHCLSELHSVLRQQLGGLWISRQSSGVPTVVTGELTGKVGRGCTGERSQVFGSVLTSERTRCCWGCSSRSCA
ncbi:hypothetical protein Mapa_014191 [Marchantia paleacea]|nr:hypothetical protein Mapa_014191 [Marchantia paleacea]